MDVAESEWISKAIDNVDRYLHRGGKYKGDEPQLLGGTDLLNTIGTAMWLPIRDPSKWTEKELSKALNNELVYYEGKAREAIDVVANQIRSCCNGDDKNFITVLPIELYYEGKLYEVPLFRAQRYNNSKKYYVDNIGRSYDSVRDWFENSKLPPCKMAYPYKLTLVVRPGYDYSHVLVFTTPSARASAQTVQVVDKVAAVAGIGSSVGLLFVSGGLAAPLVVTGVATAIWGTGRAGVQLADRAMHGESVNPFTNAESRMMWLGVAANLVSFGAMGASMRLASMAVKGQSISTAFKVFVNVTNGTNVAVSGLAILNATIYLCNHRDEVSGAEALLHVASIAFWTKGLFTYKTAGTIIRDAENFAFMHINKELSNDQASELSALRKEFQNDAQLLRQFYLAASEKNIPIKNFSQILLDASAHGQIQFDGKGNLILPGGHSYSFEFLNSLPRNVRQQYFGILTGLGADQTEVFESFRRVVNDDMKLITGLSRVAVHYQVNAREATEGVISFWKRFTKMNLPSGMDVQITDGQLVLGTAPPISIPQLPHLSSPMVNFIGEHLSRLDIATSHQWKTSMPVLLKLELSGMLTVCPVTKIINSGYAVVSLNNQLQISIYKLNAISADECKRMFVLIKDLPSTLSSSKLPPELVKLCVQKHRLRLEIHRVESVQWMKTCVQHSTTLCRQIGSSLQSHEKDRLYTFKSTVDTFKATPYMQQMMSFVSERNPRTVSETVAYCEFVVKYVETEKLMLEQKLRDGKISMPINVKKSEWMRKKASENVFKDTNAMHQKFTEMMDVVTKNKMVGVEVVAKSLSDSELVAALRRTDVKFGSDVSAAYHIFKHPTDPLDAYVVRANETIRSAGDRYSVTLTQDGDARTVRFESPNGSCIILERDGRVLLCTFSPKN